MEFAQISLFFVIVPFNMFTVKAEVYIDTSGMTLEKL